MLQKPTWVIAQDLIHVIFLDMNPIWLRSMWEDGGTARADMIEILISLALLKLRFKFWFVDPLWERYLILGKITFYPPEVSKHFHFCLQSLKCDTLPPPPNFQIVAIQPLWPFFFPKCPYHIFYFIFKKIQKKKTKKEICSVGLATPAYFFFFFKKIKK